jgi:hypothetical protein
MNMVKWHNFSDDKCKNNGVKMDCIIVKCDIPTLKYKQCFRHDKPILFSQSFLISKRILDYTICSPLNSEFCSVQMVK